MVDFNVTDQLFMAAYIAYIVVLVSIFIGPSAWLLVSLYRTWGKASVWGRAGRLIGAVVWPVIAIRLLAFIALLGGQGHDYADVSDYTRALNTNYDDSHVAHFPGQVSEEHVHDFYARNIYFPDVTYYMHIAVDGPLQQAETVHEEADERAAYVVTWTDSTSTPVILAHRSGPSPGDVPLDFPASRFSSLSQANYIAYFFEAQPNQQTAEPNANHLTYGIAFHKSRPRVLYWSDFRTY